MKLWKQLQCLNWTRTLTLPTLFVHVHVTCMPCTDICTNAHKTAHYARSSSQQVISPMVWEAEKKTTSEWCTFYKINKTIKNENLLLVCCGSQYTLDWFSKLLHCESCGGGWHLEGVVSGGVMSSLLGARVDPLLSSLHDLLQLWVTLGLLGRREKKMLLLMFWSQIHILINNKRQPPPTHSMNN